MAIIPFKTPSADPDIEKIGYLNLIGFGELPQDEDGQRITAESLAKHRVTAQEMYAALLQQMILKGFLNPTDARVTTLAEALQAEKVEETLEKLRPLGVQLTVKDLETPFAESYQARKPHERAYGVVPQAKDIRSIATASGGLLQQDFIN
jgi:hypothetical protein